MNEFITEIWIMILLISFQYNIEYIHMPYFTTEFNIMNSENWILIYFQYLIYIMNSC